MEHGAGSRSQRSEVGGQRRRWLEKRPGQRSKEQGAGSMEKRSEVSVQPGTVGWVERLFDRRVSPFH